MPSVWITSSTLPVSQVSFPFSRSMMNRRPVPDVSASAFCVTPSFFRVSRISFPISAVVYFTGGPTEVTAREYYLIFVPKKQKQFPFGNI